MFGTGEALPSRRDSNTFSELLLGPTLSSLAVLGHLALRIAHESEQVVRALVDTASDCGSEDELRNLLSTVHEAVRLSALMIVLVLQTHARAVFRRVHASKTAELSRAVVEVHAVIRRIHTRVHVGHLLTQQSTEEGGVAFLFAVRDDVSRGKVQRSGFAQFTLFHVRFVRRTRVLLVQHEVLGAPQGDGGCLVIFRHVGRTLEKVVVPEPFLLVPGIPPFDPLHGKRHTLTLGGGHVRAAVDEASRDTDVRRHVVLSIEHHVRVRVELEWFSGRIRWNFIGSKSNVLRERIDLVLLL